MIRGLLIYAFSERFEEMARFYRAALGVEGDSAGPSWLAFPFGASRLAFHRQLPDEPQDTNGYRLDLLVDDIDAAVARFEQSGADCIRGIQDEAFGRSAVLRDPEGREFTLVEEEAP